MTLYVSEHPSDASPRQPATKGPLAQYTLSSGAAGPFPQAGTKFIRVSADAGMLLNLSTTSTSVTITSTNSFRIPANAPPELFAVSTTFRIQAQSS